MIIDRKTAFNRYGQSFVDVVMGNRAEVEVSRHQDRILTLYRRVKEDRVIPYCFQSLYVIGADNGAYKVGYTTNIKRRFMELSGGYPGKLTLHGITLFWIGGAWQAEAEAHKRLTASRINGEWFTAPLDEIQGTIADLTRKMAVKPVPLADAWEESAALEPFFRSAWKGDGVKMRQLTDAKNSFLWLVDRLAQDT